MIEKLFRHTGWLKLFSIALALLLWVMVMPTYTAEITRSLEIPLVVQPHPSYKNQEGDLPATVQVQVLGKRLVVSRLKPEDFQAIVDFSRIQEAGKPVQLTVEVSGPKGLQIQQSVNPKTVLVTLYNTGTVTVPVVVEPRGGIVAWGGREHRFDAFAEVSDLQLNGRSDLLNRIKEGRIVLDPGLLIPGQSTLHLHVNFLDDAGRLVEGVTVSKLQVDLEWQELPEGKSFPIKAVTRGVVPEGYQVTGIEVVPPAVSIRPATVDGKLPDREVVESSPVDLTGQIAPFTTSVRLVPPLGTLAATDSVTVKVTIAEITLEKIFRALPIQVIAPPTDATVILPVSSVQILMKGPYSVMAPLDGSAVQVSVDLSGMALGTHMTPVRVTQPPGLTQLVIDPAVIEVVIGAP